MMCLWHVRSASSEGDGRRGTGPLREGVRVTCTLHLISTVQVVDLHSLQQARPAVQQTACLLDTSGLCVRTVLCLRLCSLLCVI